jgi:hypothetical protein
MSETKAPASNVVSKESLQRKQQCLRDSHISVPTATLILAEKEQANVGTK